MSFYTGLLALFELFHFEVWKALLVADLHFQAHWIQLASVIFLAVLPLLPLMLLKFDFLTAAICCQLATLFGLDIICSTGTTLAQEMPRYLFETVIPLGIRAQSFIFISVNCLFITLVIAGLWKLKNTSGWSLSVTSAMNGLAVILLTGSLINVLRARNVPHMTQAIQLSLDQAGRDTSISDQIQPNKVAIARIFIFGDFECPFTQSLLPELVRGEFQKFQIHWVNLPLTGIHPGAMSAAVASEFVTERGLLADSLVKVSLLTSLNSKLTPRSVEMAICSTHPNKDLFKQNLSRVMVEMSQSKDLKIVQTPSAVVFYRSRAYLLDGLEAIRHCIDWIDPAQSQLSKE